MTAEQMEAACNALLDKANSCDTHILRGEWRGVTWDADALRYFREQAAAFRAAVAVLRAHGGMKEAA